jgi:hypothetical protein
MIPSLVVYPRAEIASITAQVQAQKDSFFSYDNILNLLEEIEEGELENRCSPEELERINQFIAYLAKEGTPTNKEFILENDIQELLYGEDNPSFSFDTEDEYLIVPAISYSQGEALLCKSWVKKKSHQTKKFVKKHKKALIIGAVVVVAATVVICAVAAASTAGAAAAAGAAASSGSHKEKSSSTVKEQVLARISAQSETHAETSFTIAHEAPHLKVALDEHISPLKEFITEDEYVNSDYSKGYNDDSFKEQARDFGALAAHMALDGICELASFIPQISEEVKEIATKVFPDCILQPVDLPNDLFQGASMESYEALFAAGHQKIDQVFSTDQAELYRTHDKIIDFDVGILPPPGILSGIFSSTELLESGKVIDRGGLTKVGRALMKHGYRENSIFPKPIGNPTQVNEHGIKVLESILNHPEKKIIPGEFERFGKVVDIYAPDIGGVRYSTDGEFIGFLEP